MTTFSNIICAGTICSVELRNREIGFIPMSGQPVDGLPLVLPLELVQGLNVTLSSKAATCLLTISTNEKPLVELSFLPQSAFAAIQKAHIKARDNFACTLECALAADARKVCSPPAVPQAAPAPPPAKQPAETARMRKGRELRELLQRVSKLYVAHKPKEAERLLEEATAADSGFSVALSKKRAQHLRAELFTYGGLELTKSVIMHFLHLPEVKLLLPESAKQAQQEVTDSKTARTLLEVSLSPSTPLANALSLYVLLPTRPLPLNH